MIVQQPRLFRPKQDRRSTARSELSRRGGQFRERNRRTIKVPSRASRGTHNEVTIADRFRKMIHHARRFENVAGADSRTRFSPGGVERRHHHQVIKAKVGHGACCSADIKRITGPHKDNAPLRSRGNHANDLTSRGPRHNGPDYFLGGDLEDGVEPFGTGIGLPVSMLWTALITDVDLNCL